MFPFEIKAIEKYHILRKLLLIIQVADFQFTEYSNLKFSPFFVCFRRGAAESNYFNVRARYFKIVRTRNKFGPVSKYTPVTMLPLILPKLDKVRLRQITKAIKKPILKILSLTLCLSFIDPLPRTAILHIVSSCNRLSEFPFGPNSFPTKLNCKKKYNCQKLRFLLKTNQVFNFKSDKTQYISDVSINQNQI